MNYIENMITNADIISITNKRPFILSRSTALGHGKYSFHWLGDNTADYEHMRNGVNGIFQFQIYGVPMTGDDICGFFNDSWDELCARWMSLGSFFPFSRNHNHADYKSQEPYVFGKNSLTYKSSKLALNMKYSLLRYYYTNLFKVSLGEKGSFFKPLFFEYYSDLNTTLDMAESFMIGDSFIIYPIYKNETDDIEVYMPKDDWNIFPTGEIYKSKGNWTGGKIKLSGEYNKIHIFMRGGKIFPYQNTFNKFIPNSKALNKEKTELYIIPDSETHIANGDIIFDNDEYDTLSSKNYYYIHIEFYMNMMLFSTNNEMKTNYEYKDIYVSKLKFFRMKYLIENEKYDIARVELKNGKVVHVLINYLSDDIFEFDLSKNNIRFYEIDRVLFIKNN
jgi:alpha-glucosidase (family GH31 glycosyl hydrolase)